MSPRKRQRDKRNRKLPRLYWTLTLFLPLVSAFVVYMFLRPLPQREAETPPVQKPHVPSPLPSETIKEVLFSFLFEQGVKRHMVEVFPDKVEIRLPKAVRSSLVLSLKDHFERAGFSIKEGNANGMWLLEVQNAKGERLIVGFPQVGLKKPLLAVVVDDLGEDAQGLEMLMEIAEPFTFSFLPFATRTKELAQKARRRGFEVLLHLPMEPKGYPLEDPGKGALLCSMEEGTLVDQTPKALSQIPFVSGANNHMGSHFTEDFQRMRVVFRVLKQKGMFFLDSLTTPHSMAKEAARVEGLRLYVRDVFLDNGQDTEDFNRQWDLLLKKAYEKGEAIGICHPYKSTLMELKEKVLSLKDVELVPLSWLSPYL